MILIIKWAPPVVEMFKTIKSSPTGSLVDNQKRTKVV
jgi:hypothetical protein